MPQAHAAATLPSADLAQRAETFPANRKLVLAAIAGASVLVNIDLSAVNVALDEIQDDLSFTVGETAWVLNGYSLSFACLIAVAGRIGDTWGRRRTFITGVVVFLVASLLDGLAQEGWWLIGARVVQGGGAAFMFPAMLAIAAVTYPGRERAVAIGTIIAVASASQGLGPLMGGIVAEFIDWRWIFFINVPVAVAVLVAAVRFIPESRDERSPPIGWIDAAVLTVALVAITIGLDQGGSWGWASPLTILVLAAGILLLVAFVVLEGRVRHPLVGVELLANWRFQACNAAGGLLYFVFFPALMYVALLFQQVMGYSAFEAGAALVPMVALTAVLSRPIGKLAVHTGPTRPMTAGFALFAVGSIALALVVDVDTTYLAMLVPLLLIGAGIGFAVSLNASTAVGTVAPERSGSASGVNFAIRLMGGVIGLAVVTTIFESEDAGAGSGGQPFVDAFRTSMVVLAIAAAVGAVVNQLWVRDPDRPD